MDILLALLHLQNRETKWDIETDAIIERINLKKWQKVTNFSLTPNRKTEWKNLQKKILYKRLIEWKTPRDLVTLYLHSS